MVILFFEKKYGTGTSTVVSIINTSSMKKVKQVFSSVLKNIFQNLYFQKFKYTVEIYTTSGWDI